MPLHIRIQGPCPGSARSIRVCFFELHCILFHLKHLIKSHEVVLSGRFFHLNLWRVES
jgi:hypothetical protein